MTTGADGAVGDEWWAGVRQMVGRLERAADAAGRDPQTIDRYLSLDSGGTYSLRSVGDFEDAVGRAAELGFTDVISHWPRTDGIYAGSEDVLGAIAEKLDGWRS